MDILKIRSSLPTETYNPFKQCIFLRVTMLRSKREYVSFKRLTDDVTTTLNVRLVELCVELDIVYLVWIQALYLLSPIPAEACLAQASIVMVTAALSTLCASYGLRLYTWWGAIVGHFHNFTSVTHHFIIAGCSIFHSWSLYHHRLSLFANLTVL